MTKQPVNIQLNIAVRHITDRLFPLGFDASPAAVYPPVLSTLKRIINGKAGERLVVWSGESENTIYACPETNWAARAWHDWHHGKHGFDFTLGGERKTAESQARDLIELYGTGPDVVDMVELLLAEVIGQAEFYERTGGRFPTNQRQFSTLMAPMFRQHAERVVGIERRLAA